MMKLISRPRNRNAALLDHLCGIARARGWTSATMLPLTYVLFLTSAATWRQLTDDVVLDWTSDEWDVAQLERISR
jgi:hypothetical protein